MSELENKLTLNQIRAALLVTFPDTGFATSSLLDIPEYGPGKYVSISWRLGPSEEVVKAVTDAIRRGITVLVARYEPCVVCGQTAFADDGVHCFECDPGVLAADT